MGYLNSHKTKALKLAKLWLEHSPLVTKRFVPSSLKAVHMLLGQIERARGSVLSGQQSFTRWRQNKRGNSSS